MLKHFTEKNLRRPANFTRHFMSNKIRLSCLLLCACSYLCCCGCCTNKASDGSIEIERFKREHPAEFRQFIYLNPVNLDTYRCMLGFQFGAVCGIAKELKLKFGSNPDIRDFADKAKDQDGEECGKTLREYSELEASCKPGGVVCQFAWTDRTTKEVGLLAIKDGKIIKRDVWVINYLKDKP